MATNAANARIFGSDNDAVFIAPAGTALPTDLAAPAATFVDAGWLHTDGVPFTPADSVTKFRGHQGGRVIRTKIVESDLTFQFQCLETTAQTLGLQWNITNAATVTGTTTLDVSSGRKVITRAFVLDFYDDDNADIHYRYAIPAGEIGERSEFTLSNSDIVGYTFTVEVLNAFKIITNDPAVDVTP